MKQLLISPEKCWQWLGFEPVEVLPAAVKRKWTPTQEETVYRISELETASEEISNVCIELSWDKLPSEAVVSIDASVWPRRCERIEICASGEIRDKQKLQWELLGTVPTGKQLLILDQTLVMAEAEYTICELMTGTGKVLVDRQMSLAGDKACAMVQTAYDLQQAFLGWQTELIFQGKQAKGEIKTVGRLHAGAAKRWQACLDFRPGCVDSVGRESEQVWTSGDEVINRSLPLIKAEEEKIKADHSVSSGQITDEVLVYLMSRGLSERQARQLFGMSQLVKIIEQVRSRELREIMYNKIIQI